MLNYSSSCPAVDPPHVSTPMANITPEQDPDNPYKVAQGYIMDVAVPTVCAFGVLGNILNLVVLTREKLHHTLTKMEQSAHSGLIGLAVSDFMFCCLALLFTILPFKGIYKAKTAVMYYALLGDGIISMFILTSTWLIVCMAGERYVAVCHPFKARTFISLKKTKLTIILIYLCCALFSIPLFLEDTVVHLHCPGNATMYMIKQRQGYTDVMHSARRMVWSIVADFIPCLSLIFFNVCLIWRIQKAKRLRSEMQLCCDVNATGPSSPKHWSRCSASESSQHEHSVQQALINGTHGDAIKYNEGVSENSANKMLLSQIPNRSGSGASAKPQDSALNSVTATLVSIIVLFLILVSPSEILKYATCPSSNDCMNNPKYLLIRDVTNFMQAINFSVNFVLYCAISKSFRDTLASLVCIYRKPTEVKVFRVPMNKIKQGQGQVPILM